MKSSVASLASVVAVVRVASADFLLYYGMNTHIPDTGSSTGWFTFDGEPNCDDVYNSIMHQGKADVSGTKWGARCKGCDGDDWTAEDVEELEININVDGDGPHWSKWPEDPRRTPRTSMLNGNSHVQGPRS